MSKEVSVKFGEQEFEFNKETTQWSLIVKKSDIKGTNEKELVYLSVENENLLPCTYVWEEDQVLLSYELSEELQTFERILKLRQVQKIQLGLNLAHLAELLRLPLSFFLDPENIVFDRNLLPKLAYRGIAEKMPPYETKEEDFLRQYKSLLIHLFYPKFSFHSLYEGNLETVSAGKFVSTVQNATSVEEITEYMSTLYQETKLKDERTNRMVSCKSFRLFQQLSIWLGVLAVLFAIAFGYLFFVREPYQEKMLRADTAFLKKDYEEVIQSLEKVKTDEIGQTQKYELAYAFIQGKDLSETQKNFILNNISLRSDSNNLAFWIENGRGDFDNALDLAKKLEDRDLILYGILQKMDQVKSDTKLSGTECEEQLGALQQDYEKYVEKFAGSGDQEGEPGKFGEKATTYGTKYSQIIPIKDVNGKIIDVEFVWIKNNDGIVRLVTSIPTKK